MPAHKDEEGAVGTLELHPKKERTGSKQPPTTYSSGALLNKEQMDGILPLGATTLDSIRRVRSKGTVTETSKATSSSSKGRNHTETIDLHAKCKFLREQADHLTKQNYQIAKLNASYATQIRGLEGKITSMQLSSLWGKINGERMTATTDDARLSLKEARASLATLFQYASLIGQQLDNLEAKLVGTVCADSNAAASSKCLDEHVTATLVQKPPRSTRPSDQAKKSSARSS